MDGASLAAALCSKADDAWVGTQFLATYRKRTPSESAAWWLTKVSRPCATPVFGRHHAGVNPMRVMRNRVMCECDARLADTPVDNIREFEIGNMHLWNQVTVLRKFQNLVSIDSAVGDFEELPLLCSEGVSGARDIALAVDVWHRTDGDAAEMRASLRPPPNCSKETA